MASYRDSKPEESESEDESKKPRSGSPISFEINTLPGSYLAQPKVNRIWNDVLTDQTLSQELTMGAGVDEGQTSNRAAESYPIPDNHPGPTRKGLYKNLRGRKKHENTRAKDELDQDLDIYQAGVDTADPSDPFADVHTEPPVPEMGVGTKKDEETGRKRHREKEKEKKKERRPYRKAGGANLPSKNLHLNPASPPEVLGEQIAQALNEKKPELIKGVVGEVGASMAIRLFYDTLTVEERGGLMTLNGSRRRTPGGVFLFLLREDAMVTPEQKQRIFFNEKNTVRKFAKIRKKAKRNASFEESLEDAKRRMAQWKEQREQDKEREKSLKTANEVFLEETMEMKEEGEVDAAEDGSQMEETHNVVDPDAFLADDNEPYAIEIF